MERSLYYFISIFYIFGLFGDAISNSACIAFNDNDINERIWKEVAVP
jgi:hypothetical protein